MGWLVKLSQPKFGQCLGSSVNLTLLSGSNNPSIFTKIYSYEQLKRFHINANLLLRKFGKCTLNTKLELFRSYCTNNMYCGIFWNDATKKKSLTKLCVSYNNSFRRLFGLPYFCIASEIFVYPVTFLPSQKLQGR